MKLATPSDSERNEDDDIGAMHPGGISILAAGFAAIRGMKNAFKKRVNQALSVKAQTGRPGRENRSFDC